LPGSGASCGGGNDRKYHREKGGQTLPETRDRAGPGVFAGGHHRRQQDHWLAGQVGAADALGKSLAGDFDGQVREVFSRLGRTLEEAGGTLADMVTMTVFITDARYGDRFTQLRKEIFGDNFPASALITVAGLARPEMLVEVQGIAVIG
jgi:enamine deaminase RidA (YjgF/YER057c/UK114 family)